MDRPETHGVSTPARLEVGGFVIDLGQETLFDARRRPVELRPQAWQVLRQLALGANGLVTKEALMAAVWPGMVVTDDSLVQAIGDVRRAFGDAGRSAIRTVPRRGYMLMAAPPPADGKTTGAPRDRFLGPKRWVWAGIALLGVVGAMAFLAGPLRTGAALDPGGPPSIAVLAFNSPEGDVDGAALARDVAADLVSELARSADLRVVSSQSSFLFAGEKTPLAEIGRRLRSRHLVDGNVRREGERLRMVVELIDSQDGRVLWTSSEVVDRTGLGAAQLALVGRIAGTLQSKVARNEQQRALAQPPRTLDSYVLVARGRTMLARYDAQGVREARRFFTEALAIDPGYAPAWAYLGITNTVDIGLDLTGEWDEKRIGEVVTQIRQAIALQPDLPVAYVALSQAHSREGNLDAALAAAHEACRLSPNDFGCFYILGAAQLQVGQVDSALRNLEQAMDRNPIPPAFLPAFHASALWAGHRCEEAIRVAEACLAKAPAFWRCSQERIVCLVDLGRVPEARAEAAQLRTRVPQMTAQSFGSTFGREGAPLRERRIAAARAAGIPDRSSAPP